jgi:segregation and condensation protein B
MDKRNYCNLQEDSTASYFQIKRILEALLFSSTEALPFSRLQAILEEEFPVTPKEIQRLLQELAEEYRLSHRAFFLEKSENGYRLRALEDYAPYLEKLHADRRAEKLSGAALEVLAIVAYRGPVTRPGIEALRGVDSSNVLLSLQERGLVEITGRQETPGRPSLYGVTSRFLDHFGLQSLKELPQLT